VSHDEGSSTISDRPRRNIALTLDPTSIDLRALGWSAEHARHLEPGLEPGRVVAVHRGAIDVSTAGGILRTPLPGRFAFDATDVAVGDWVGLADVVVDSVLPRRSALVRNAAGRATRAQTLVANVDVAFLVSSLGPELDARRIERYLVTIWESGASPEIVLTKADRLADPGAFVAVVETAAPGVPVHVVSAVSGQGCDRLRARIEPGTTAVLLGSSGVGKSTLVNRFAGRQLMTTTPTREGDDEGRHTTSHRELFLLPGGGVVIDTPGLRELQLAEGAAGLEVTFSDVDTLAGDCRFADCNHAGEPGCAVAAAVESGALPPERLRSWHKLQRELVAIAIRRDRLLRKEETRRWRLLSREARARARHR
jgi:ribosome biogenesis GTPase / thiamine phosphate phosphatase